MDSIYKQVNEFVIQQERNVRAARQNAALFLTSGIDLADALALRGERRKITIIRLGRLLERERLRGIRQHWSYDLNRHIALKQAYDTLTCARNGGNASAC